MFAMAGLGINRLTAMNKSIGDTYDILYGNVKLNQRLQQNISEIGRNMITLILNESSDDISVKMANIEKNDTALRQIFNEMRIDYENAEQLQVTEGVIESGNRYLAYKDRIVELMTKGNTEGAVRLRSEEGLKLQMEIQAGAGAFVNYHERKMDQILADGSAENRRTLQMTIGLTLIGLLLSLGITYWIIQSITRGFNILSQLIGQMPNSSPNDHMLSAAALSRDEIGEVVQLFLRMAGDLEQTRAIEQEYSKRNEDEVWLKSSVTNIMVLLQEKTDLSGVGDLFIRQLAPSVGAVYGGVYIVTEQGEGRILELAGTYALDGERHGRSFLLGQGLVGQCALDKQRIRLSRPPEDYLRVALAQGELALGEVLVIPVAYEGRVLAVMELASLTSFTALHNRLLEQLSEHLGIILNSINGRMKVEELLRTSQLLTEELQSQSEELLSQQDELRTSYDRLEQQARALQESEELLQQQSEELTVTNEELTLKTALLEEQVRVTNEKNREVELANQVLEHQAVELEIASKYKTEFLANMSHELRTPLNSMMILSRMLEENKDGNLNAKQREYASTIHSAGEDLLRLIDDVLDLSKVEAGHMEIQPERVLLSNILHYVKRSFESVAERTGVELLVEVQEGLPDSLVTDEKRLTQIVGNLLSNAFKFTTAGSVTFSVAHVDVSWSFIVKDTGIGIPANKLEEIFHAFRQANGTTNRTYGGTGLGLSISRQLSKLLQGSITVESVVGGGSVFTLIIPDMSEMVAAKPLVATAMFVAPPAPESLPEAGSEQTVQDELNQERTELDGKRLLLVDDDIRNLFALSSVLEDYGFKVSFAENGHEAVTILRNNPDFDLILMDIMMPQMDGYEAMQTIRAMPGMKGLPIIALTAKAMHEDRDKCLRAGASDYLTKPIDLQQLLSLIKMWLHE
jgi:signal transduction histidine kinase